MDITNKDAIGIEWERPNKTRFIYVDKAGDPDLVPTPSTLTVVAPATNGEILYTDNIGIFIVKGLWSYRGIYREDIGGGVIQNFPGSWISRRVGK